MGLKIIILAAGKGKRMASCLPKVLHLIGGKTMLEHVVNTAESLNPENIIVVVGNGKEKVKKTCSHLNVTWVEQTEQLGTGHAVMQALPHCQSNDRVLVLYGDVPLISTRLLRQLIQDTLPNGLGLVAAELEDPRGFGRIVRNELGNIVKIVEHKDAVDWQLNITEVNTGIISAESNFLQKTLPELKNKNSQQEYYLTDIIGLAVSDGIPISGVLAHDPIEVFGVNDRWQQVTLERQYQIKQAKKIALLGAHLADHQRFDVRGDLSVGIDTFIDINCLFEGQVVIGERCQIGHNVSLKNVTIEDDVVIKSNSVLEGAHVKSNAVVGPFARLREESIIDSHARVGNFVEVKKTRLGSGSKANHLTYLGDSTIGQNVNIGAGTITCNYDGVNKHHTSIDDHVFIGSNSSLVAPLSIGEGATVGAGSTITKDVLPEKLVLERTGQKTVDGWKRPQKKNKKDTI
jgi:bifunctional UDP-N-acetylglucosamine pyrophosphorylase / glucosamine-1-phosphate N-acetyltransferase